MNEFVVTLHVLAVVLVVGAAITTLTITTSRRQGSADAPANDER